MASLDQFGSDPNALKKLYIAQLLKESADTSPIRSWTQGAARLAQALTGGYMANQDLQQQQEAMGQLGALLAPNTTGAAPMPSAPRSIESAPISSATPYGSNVATTDNGNAVPLPPSNPLGQLNPVMRTRFADLRSALANQGVDINAPEAGSIGNVRTPEQQAGLYAQGRTAPGPIVTGTLNSNHLTGNALDVVPLNASPSQVGSAITNLTQNDPRFAGMRSGATFSNLYDPLHVEINNPQVAANAPQDTGLPPGATPTQFAGNSPPTPAPQAAPPVDIKSRIAQLLASNNPYAQQLGQRLAMSAIAPALSPPQAMKIQNRDGSESIVFVNPSQMQAYGQGGKPLNSDTISGGTPHPELSGEEFGAYLQKSDPGRYNLIQGMLSGNVAPAQLSRYGTKQVQALLEDAARIDPSFTQASFDARHKMATELGSTSTMSLGGRLQSLKNSIEHLANTSDAAIATGNKDLGAYPLSAPVNAVRSLSTAQQDAINKLDSEARTYGGERTKFLTGRAGTEEERKYLSNKINGVTAAPSAMAGTLEGEYTQMADALLNQEKMIRDTMGEKYLKAHPVLDADQRAKLARLETNIGRLRGGGPIPSLIPGGAESSPSLGGVSPAQAAVSGGISEGATATNPSTGQKIIFKNGQWMPLQ